jgi:Protein of unknown function (DUF2971)
MPQVRLYKFMSAEYGMRAIRERRLRISRIDQLNDDFEFIGIALALKEDRIALREMRKQLGAANGIICMSEEWSSPQMWAHYADSHKGMVLGFDVIPQTYFPVRYEEKRPTLESMGLSRFDEMSEKDMELLVRMKAKGWEYERERRAFIRLEDGVRIDGQVHYFLDFGPGLDLKEVIVGTRFRTERAEVERAVAKHDVAIFMARGDFEDFKVVRQNDPSMWR